MKYKIVNRWIFVSILDALYIMFTSTLETVIKSTIKLFVSDSLK